MITRTSFVLMLAVISGCAGPKIYVQDLRIDSFDGNTAQFTVTVVNSGTSGPGLCRPKTAKGPITLQAWSSHTQDLSSGNRAQGGRQIVPADGQLEPGQSVSYSGQTVNPLIPGNDIYLVLQAYTSAANVTFPNPAVDPGLRCQKHVGTKAIAVPY